MPDITGRFLRFGIFSFVAACLPVYLAAAPLVPAPGLSQPDPESGRGVAVGAFNSEPSGACFQCHGLNGGGDAAAAFPRLTGQVYAYLLKSLQDYASGERENAIMEPIARALTQQQMRDVAAFYAAQADAPYPPRSDSDYELLQLGGALAAVGSAERGIQGCVNCHGPEGTGLAPTYPYLAGQHETYLEAQLLGWKNGTRRSDLSGIMTHIAGRMTEEEIRAVAIYYASIRSEDIPERLATSSADRKAQPAAGGAP